MKNGSGAMVLIILTLGFFLCGAVYFARQQANADPALDQAAIGNMPAVPPKDPNRYLGDTIQTDALCAPSKAIETEILAAAERGDAGAVAGISLREDVVRLPADTRVEQAGGDGPLALVLVKSGFYVDRECWVSKDTFP